MKKTLFTILFLLPILCTSAQEAAKAQINSKDDFAALLNSGKDIGELTNIMKSELLRMVGDKSVILEDYAASLAQAKEGTDLDDFTQLVLKMVDCMAKVQPSPDWDMVKSVITATYQAHLRLKEDK